MTELQKIIVQWDFKPIDARMEVLAAYFPEMPEADRRQIAATNWSRLSVRLNHYLTYQMSRGGK